MNPVVVYKGLSHFFSLWGGLLLLIVLAGCNAKEVESFDLKISSVSPTTGPRTGGTLLTINGYGLSYIRSLTIGGVDCEDLAIINDGMASCMAPPSEVGSFQVLGVNSIGKTSSSSFSYYNVPVIESISPSVGSAGGATFITITGSGFEAGATVDLGGVACVGVSVVNENLITCNTGAHSSGIVLTTVSNSTGKTGTSRSFAYRNKPTVTSVLPNGGPLAGGSTVTVIGTGFSIGATVTFGSGNCSNVNVLSTNQLTCTIPPQVAGPVSVTVLNNTGLGGSGSNVFTYRNAPTVTNVAPVSGNATGGTELTITGTGFLSGPSVLVGNSYCGSVIYDSATQIRCTTAAHGDATVNVTVANSDSQSGTLTNSYQYMAAPYVSSIAPNNGPLGGGTTLIISGNYFRAGATVSLGTEPCAINSVAMTSIECESDSTLTPGPQTVIVTNTGTDGQSGSLLNGFTYRAAPTVTSANPVVGAVTGGTVVTVTGTGFYTGATVGFGGTDCTSVTVNPSGNSLTCTTGSATAGGVTITVTNDDQQTATSAGPLYTYQNPPTIASLTPSRGVPSGGTLLVITGTNFFAGALAHIGGQSCTPLTVNNVNQITCTTPANPEGPTTVVVTNTDGQTGSSVGGYNYQSVLLDWDVATYDYGSTSTNAIKTFTLTNSGEASSGAITVLTSGVNAASWEVSTDTCSAGLAPSASCTVYLTFLGSALSTLGAYTAFLELTSVSNANAISELTGTIVDGSWNFNFSAYDHGDQDSNNNVDIWLTNIGVANRTISTVSLVGTNPEAWSIIMDNCTGALLEPNDDCLVQARFLAGGLTNNVRYSVNLRVEAIGGSIATFPLMGRQVP